eukprot:Skav200752  [mRNA]  locus=scaffold1117:384609:389142:- [translate_table: standard]
MLAFLLPAPLRQNLHSVIEVTVFHCKTPRYVLHWLRDWHNSWHAGQGQSLVERYLKIPTIDATFSCMCKTKGWSARSCGKGEDSWRGRKWTFVQAHSPRFFVSMLSFENAASSYKYLKEKGWVESALAFMDASTMWDDNRLDNAVAIDCIHKWLLCLTKYNMTDEFGLIMFLEGVRFMLPTVQVPAVLDGVKVATSGLQVDMIFIKDTNHKILWVSAPMKDSVLFDDDASSKAKRKAAPTLKVAEPASKRKRSSGTAASSSEVGKSMKEKGPSLRVVVTPSASDAKLLEAHEESAAAQVEDDGKPTGRLSLQARDIQWLDDAYQLCVQTLEASDLCNEDGEPLACKTQEETKKMTIIRQQLFGIFMSSALSFAWNKTITLKNKQIKTWSMVRPALVEVVTEAAQKAKKGQGATAVGQDFNVRTGSGSGGDGGGEEENWQNELLTACEQSETKTGQQAEEPETAGSLSSVKKMVRNLLESHGAKLENHIATFDGKPLQANPCYQMAFQTLWGQTVNLSVKGGLGEFVEMTLIAIEQTHSVELLSLAAALTEYKPDSVGGLLVNDKKLTSVAKSRATFFQQLLKSFLDGLDANGDEHPLSRKEFEAVAGTMKDLLTNMNKSVIAEIQQFEATVLLTSGLSFEHHVQVWQFMTNKIASNSIAAVTLAKRLAGTLANPKPKEKDDSQGPPGSTSSGAAGGVGDSAMEDDAAEGDGENQSTSKTTLAELMTAWNPDVAPAFRPLAGMDDEVPTVELQESDFNLATLLPVISCIEARLMQLAFMTQSMQTYAHMSVDIAAKQVIVTTTKKPTDLDWIPFAGRVTLNRHNTDSYMLCALWPEGDGSTKLAQSGFVVVAACLLHQTAEVLKHPDGCVKLPLYVTGDKHKSLSSEHIVPAFCCKTAPFGSSTLLLSRQSETIDLSNMDNFSLDEIEISVPGLQPHESWQPQEEQWELTRPFVQIKAASAGKKNKAKSNTENAKDANESKEGPASDVFAFKGKGPGQANKRLAAAELRMQKNVQHLLK